MKFSFSLLIAATWLLTGCSTQVLDEREIDVSEVPDEVLEAAREAVPGFEPSEAEIEFVYELEGQADGRTYEIEIDADGEVKEVEAKDE
ncbi:MAG: PepSY domain-containing protein [Woeseiaceae bacterium]|nr:PepSY domain-containing protein [Woeseiaceae bacterium]